MSELRCELCGQLDERCVCTVDLPELNLNDEFIFSVMCPECFQKYGRGVQ